MNSGTDQTRLVDEQLSAWLDDELPAGEMVMLLARLEQSPELRARAARFGLITSSLRDGLSGNLDSQLPALHLSDRVRAAINEPAAGANAPVVSRTRRLIPYGVAAVLALLAVLIVPGLKPTAVTPRADGGLVARNPAPGADPSVVAGSMVRRAGFGGPSAISPRRMTSYLVYHGEYSGMLSATVADSHIVNQRAYATAGLVVDGNLSP